MRPSSEADPDLRLPSGCDGPEPGCEDGLVTMTKHDAANRISSNTSASTDSARSSVTVKPSNYAATPRRGNGMRINTNDAGAASNK